MISKDSDQTAQKRSLIFANRTSPIVGFVMRWLILSIFKEHIYSTSISWLLIPIM